MKNQISTEVSSINLKDGKVSPKGNLTSVKGNFGVLKLRDGSLFIAGGHDQQNKVTGECEVLGQGLRAPMVVARQAHSMVQVQDCVYAFGGMGEQSTLLSSVERINLAASQPKWELIGHLPVACCNPGLLATSNGQVLILGGKTLTQSLSEVYLFDLKTLFTKVGSLQQPDAFS